MSLPFRFSFHFLMATVAALFIQEAAGHDSCVAFESSYHIDQGCRCTVYESDGRSGGSFTSPGFPSPYPTSINCTLYTFIGDLNEIVELTFTDFDLQVPSADSQSSAAANSCPDHVRLHLDLDRPELNDRLLQQSSLHLLCGGGISSLAQTQFYSSKRSLIVEFHSDPIQTNNTGFKATYRFLDKGQFEMIGVSRRWGDECFYDFFSNKNLRQGRFFSPRYPQNYPVGSRCRYLFHGQRDEVVAIALINVRLTAPPTASTVSTASSSSSSSSDGCSNDSIFIIDGGSNFTGTESVLLRICSGRRIVYPLFVSSTRSQLLIDFRSVRRRSEVTDEWGGQGFEGSFEFQRSSSRSPNTAEAQTPSGHPTTTSVSGTRDHITMATDAAMTTDAAMAMAEPTSPLPDVILEPHNHPRDSPLVYADPVTSSYLPTVHANEPCEHEYSSKEEEEEERGIVEAGSGKRIRRSFSSPFYPLTYPPFLTCRYIFRCAADRERVQITVTDLDLAHTSDTMDDTGCDGVDRLVAIVSIGSSRQEIGVFCGRMIPPVLMSSGPEMEVVFTSATPLQTTASNSEPRGFRAQYAFVTNFGIRSGDQRLDTICGFDFLSQKSFNGSFSSPNFPGLYPRSTECHYLFYGRIGERVHISFELFDVEGIPPSCHSSTQSDFVEFSNFNIDVVDRKMARLCGSESTIRGRSTVTSDGNFFRVTFKSNEVYDGTGFQARYQFIPARGRVNSTADTGPGSGPGADRRWKTDAVGRRIASSLGSDTIWQWKFRAIALLAATHSAITVD